MPLMKSFQIWTKFPRYKVCLLTQVRYVYRRKKPVKLFQENENESAHKTMEKLTEYNRTVRNLKSMTTTSFHFKVDNDRNMTFHNAFNASSLYPNFDERQGHLMTPTSLVSKFVEMTKTAQAAQMTLEDPSVQNLVDGLLKKLKEMTDVQLECILASMCFWKRTDSTRTPNFMALWNELDSECCNRCSKWSIEVKLRVADIWYHLRLSRISKYNSTVIRNLGRDLTSLSPSNFVHLLFLINLQRKVDSSVIINAERALFECFEVISVQELAIVAMGFFKTSNPVKSHLLLRSIVSKVTSNLETVDNTALLPIIKLLRLSATSGCTKLYYDLQKRCIPILSRLWAATIVHLALIGQSQLICCEELINRMIGRFLDEGLSEIRLKELARSVFCLAIYLPNSSSAIDYVQKVSEEMTKPERNQEVLSYPDHFVSLVYYATYFDVYSLDLISRCFNNDFITSFKENTALDVERELFALHCNIQIERPDIKYDGLPLYQRVKIFKEAIKPPNESFHGRFIANVSDHLNVILGGKEFYFIGQILPHYSPKDILVILDKEGNAKPIPHEIIGRAPSSILERNNDEKWLVIVLGGHRKRAVGHVLTKLRQLRRLGHIVIEIPWFPYHDWNEDDKRKYLRDLIFN